MRRMAMAAVCAVLGLANQADGQVNTMPGQVVGSGSSVGNVSTVGNAIPKAAPAAGQPINLPADSAMMRRYDPNRPYDVFKGTSLNPDLVAAPLSTYGEKSLLDKLKGVVGLAQPEMVSGPKSSYFPSLTRRNRERSEERLWRRD